MHNVHLTTMCYLFDGSAGVAIFVYWSAKKRKLGGGCWDLASCQLQLNSVQWFQRKSRIISANERPGGHFLFCFSDQPEKKTKLSRGCWDLASTKLSLNSVQRFQRRSRQCLSQSKVRESILFFRSAQKTQTWYRTLRSCFLSSFVEYRSAVSEEKSKNVSANQNPGRPFCFSDRP